MLQWIQSTFFLRPGGSSSPQISSFIFHLWTFIFTYFLTRGLINRDSSWLHTLIGVNGWNWFFWFLIQPFGNTPQRFLPGKIRFRYIIKVNKPRYFSKLFSLIYVCFRFLLTFTSFGSWLLILKRLVEMYHGFWINIKASKMYRNTFYDPFLKIECIFNWWYTMQISLCTQVMRIQQHSTWIEIIVQVFFTWSG